MRLFKKLGVLLGSLHVVLYLAVPVYESCLDVFGPPLIGLPVMFFFGFWWPLLLFFGFAPRRFYDEPDTQEFIRKIGRAFRIPVGRLAFRVICLVLLWPFRLINFDVLYHGLQE